MQAPGSHGRPPVREIATFATIGVVSTIAYIVLFAGLRAVLLPVPANAIALLVTAIGNTAANRRWTFGVRGGSGLVGDHLAGLAAFVVALGITSLAALGLQVAAPAAGRPVEVVVLLGASAVATVVRFVLLRTWFAIARQAVARQAVARRAVARPALVPVGVDEVGTAR
jgi:putative flippase GtrA